MKFYAACFVVTALRMEAASFFDPIPIPKRRDGIGRKKDTANSLAEGNAQIKNPINRPDFYFWNFVIIWSVQESICKYSRREHV